MDPRDQTFMTIHNLTPDANILFASDSIFDILGYQPDEVEGKSCFDYFHPKEVPFARSIHRRGVLLDKAAVLHYARILAKNGQWVSCECCFTVVHDVLVACTSIYLRGRKSERRALEAPQIRRIFSSSPRDPRYHMLEHLSPKFKMPAMEHEPRAALILNRFTRNLSIMFATNAVTSILGLRPDEIKDKAFYEIIQENCLQNAIQCLESAKANESIAYLRFNFRDPREDRARRRIQGSEEGEEGEEWEPVQGNNGPEAGDSERSDTGMNVDDDNDDDDVDVAGETSDTEYRIMDRNSSSSTALPPNPHSLDRTDLIRRSSNTGTDPPPRIRRVPPGGRVDSTLELEAVVSCTSDGLVVVLRRARPPIPDSHLPLIPAFNFENGLCAAPWGQRPIEPYVPPELLYTFRPPLRPQYMPLRENVKAAGGPPIDQALRSIREAAVFAWPLTGINGSLADYGHGEPTAGAQPPDGLPIWDPNAGPTEYQGPENEVATRRARTSIAETRELDVMPPFRPDISYPPVDTTPDNYTHNGRQQSPLKWPPSVPHLAPGSCAVERDQMPRPFTRTASHHHPQQALIQPPAHHGVELISPLSTQLPMEPWVEVGRSRTYNTSYTAPSPRAPSPGESPKDSRHLW